MNAWTLTREFMHDNGRWRRNLVMPNFTPRDWWENDICEITASGYWVEYEVKISRSDFFADAKKYIQVLPDGVKHQTWNAELKDYLPKHVDVTKHSLLEKGDARGPNRFFFITPAV